MRISTAIAISLAASATFASAAIAADPATATPDKPAVQDSPAAAVPDKLPEATAPAATPAAAPAAAPAETPKPAAQDSPAAAVPDKLPAAAETKAGDQSAALKGAIEGIQAAIKGGDQKKAEALISDFIIPEHEKWFEKTFGADKSKKISEEYAKFYKDMQQEGYKFFESTVKDNQSTIVIHRIDKADNKEATGAQKDALGAMKAPVVLYTAEFLAPGKDKGKKLWSFVEIDGKMRLAGKMRAVK